MTALPLARRMAAELAEAELRRLGTDPAGARLAVAGERLSGELTRTVTELALRHRYVLLDVPYGGEELCRQLRREYGVTLLLCPGAEQVAASEVLVLFGPRPDLPGAVRLCWSFMRAETCAWRRWYCRRHWRASCGGGGPAPDALRPPGGRSPAAGQVTVGSE